MRYLHSDIDTIERVEILRGLRAADTLEAFLRDLRARYPALGTLPASRQRAATEDRTVQAR